MKDIYTYLRTDTLDVPNLLSDTWNITDNINYWYKKGTNPIVLVAHIDTINDMLNKKASDLVLIEKNGIISAVNSVLGADDRAGVYCLEKLKELDCSLLLLNFEEVGGLGATQLTIDHPELLKDYHLFIEFDRAGIDNFVTYQYIDQEVKDVFTNFGFKEEVGTFSDIQILTEHYGVQSVNVAVCYFGQHGKGETLDIMELDYNIQFYYEIINTLIAKNKKWIYDNTIYDSDFRFSNYILNEYYGKNKKKNKKNKKNKKSVDNLNYNPDYGYFDSYSRYSDINYDLLEMIVEENKTELDYYFENYYEYDMFIDYICDEYIKNVSWEQSISLDRSFLAQEARGLHSQLVSYEIPF